MTEAKLNNYWENDPEEIETDNFNTPVQMTWDDGEKVVQETLAQIKQKGWCLWQLRNLKGQKICLIRNNEAQNYPAEYPAFSLEELEMLPDDVRLSTLKLIIIAKIKGDAIIESVEDNYEDWGTV
jgi:hypothetical protein